MYNLNHILNIIKDAEIAGAETANFNNAKPVTSADELSIVWISSKHKAFASLLDSTLAKVIVCDKKAVLSASLLKHKTFVKTNNPRLSFIRIVRKLFTPVIEYGIHQTSSIHPDANLHSKVYIGPHTHIGKCIIQKGAVIHGNCYLYDGVQIGRNVTVHSGTTIGADGFGYERNEKNELEKFPHIGGVLIEDDVEIGANTCIDKGTLGDTIIRKGAKIDNLVHIAHNVVIGKHVAVIAKSMIGGSTVIGDYSWVSPGSSLRDGIVIGKNVTIGIASNVTKNIPDGETWLGNPAKPLNEFLANKNR